jgi:uncharacterized membrane protein (UPF0136 family)
MQTYIVLAVYGALVLIGGFIGFLKAGSYASLIMGAISGLLLFATSYGLHEAKEWAGQAAFVIPFILTVFFLYRFSMTHAFMPAGLMVILGFITLFLVWKQ